MYVSIEKSFRFKKNSSFHYLWFVMGKIASNLPCRTANGVKSVKTVATSTPSNNVYFPPTLADNRPPDSMISETRNVNKTLKHLRLNASYLVCE